MSVGFVVSCNTCEKEIVSTKNLEKDSFEKITQELEKVTEGFIGPNKDAGQVQISNVEDMLLLSGVHFNCDKHCENVDYRGKIRVILKNIFKK